MGAFNTLRAAVVCPRCNSSSEVDIQFKYGSTWQREYSIGDRLSWGKNDIGEPGVGHVVVDGEAGPCALCGYDGEWRVDIFIDQGVITKVEQRSGRFDFAHVDRTYILLNDR
jgi:hypothetical protein